MVLKREKNHKYRIAIFTTQTSFSGLSDCLDDNCMVECVIVPENRASSAKVRQVIEFCERTGLNAAVHRLGDEQKKFNAWLKDLNLDLGLSWNYSQILRPETLQVFQNGVWNMHGGKIPEYRGANVLQWAIINGETEIGITWHAMNHEIDSGLLLAQCSVPIAPEENALEIAKKVNRKGIELFRNLWGQYSESGIEARQIDITNGTYYRRRTPVDGLLPEKCSLVQLANYRRALCPPWPGPIFIQDGRCYQITSEELAEEKIMFCCADGKSELPVKLLSDPVLLAQIHERMEERRNKP